MQPKAPEVHENLFGVGERVEVQRAESGHGNEGAGGVGGELIEVVGTEDRLDVLQDVVEGDGHQVVVVVDVVAAEGERLEVGGVGAEHVQEATRVAGRQKDLEVDVLTWTLRIDVQRRILNPETGEAAHEARRHHNDVVKCATGGAEGAQVV